VDSSTDSHDEVVRLRTRVERREAQMAFLMRNLGVAYPDRPDWTPSRETVDLVIKGDTKAAIRQVREETGASLKDAKELVESLQQSQKQRR
jgi:ribosomal protein L7/L12